MSWLYSVAIYMICIAICTTYLVEHVTGRAYLQFPLSLLIEVFSKLDNQRRRQFLRFVSCVQYCVVEMKIKPQSRGTLIPILRKDILLARSHKAIATCDNNARRLACLAAVTCHAVRMEWTARGETGSSRVLL